MKHKLFFRISVFILIGIMFAACKSDDDPVQLTVSKYQLKVSLEESVSNLSITSSQSWDAQSECDWISISPASGTAGKTDVKITVKENPTALEREGAFRVTAGKETKKVTITQSPQNGLLMPTSYYKASNKGGVLIPYDINGTKYEFQNNESQWIHVETIQANTPKLIIDPNSTNTDRIETLKYRPQGSSEWQQLLITQVSGNEKGGFLCLDNLTINGIPFTRDFISRKYYIPVDMDTPTTDPVKIEFAGLGVDYIKINNTEITSGQTIQIPGFTYGKEIAISICNRLVTEPNIRTLCITGLPIIEITAPEGIVDEPKRPCDIVLTDPKSRTNKSVTRYESFGGIEIRGAGAQRYDKKAYSFKLKDRATDENQDAELLGMREDQSWILDAMWLDHAKMRNRVCFDLWKDMNTQFYYFDKEPKAVSATHGYPVELFLDGTYHGLYILSDRIDRKQLKLKKKGGYLYKAGEWTDECRLQGVTRNYSNNSLAWQGIESDYPDVIGEVEFKYLYDFIKYFAETPAEEFAATFEDRLDVNSLIDYFIFINLIMAYDNTGRNIFWGIYDVNTTNPPKFVVVPWDLDGTLGRTWDAQKLDPIRGNGVDKGFVYRDNGGAKMFRPFERILKENPKGIKERIYKRFMELKDKALSPANMASKVDYYKRQIVETGAIERDRLKWSGRSMYGYTNPQEEANFMKSWYTERLKHLESALKDF